MSNNPQHTWNASNVLDDVTFKETDANEFKELLGLKTSTENGEARPIIAPGTILTGRIVEISKEHVVIDVGLKSEGIVPIEEFSDPEDLVLDGEIEVFLDKTED